MKIQIINGPNLNLLGKREPDIYGNRSFEDYLPTLQARFPDIELHYYQSNVEVSLSTSCRRWASAMTVSC